MTNIFKYKYTQMLHLIYESYKQGLITNEERINLKQILIEKNKKIIDVEEEEFSDDKEVYLQIITSMSDNNKSNCSTQKSNSPKSYRDKHSYEHEFLSDTLDVSKIFQNEENDY